MNVDGTDVKRVITNPAYDYQPDWGVGTAPPTGAPVANSDAYSTGQDTPLTVPAPGVLGNDTDPENTPLTAGGLNTTGTTGTVALNPEGSFTYTPARGSPAPTPSPTPPPTAPPPPPRPP